MRFLFSFLPLLLIAHLTAQDCNSNQHSTNANDSWQSCAVTPNPNPVRGNSHWVQYDLGYAYTINATHFWNYNVVGATNEGFRNISIDYSLDGKNWIKATSFQLSEATGTPAYAGESGPDLGNITARYILITAVDNWGGDCFGLSEVRFDVGEIVRTNKVAMPSGELEIFPNPAEHSISIKSKQPIKTIIIINSAGKEVQRMPYKPMIDISYLPSGLYFINAVRNDHEVAVKKLIKK